MKKEREMCKRKRHSLGDRQTERKKGNRYRGNR
jgi:hypothetical protein